MKNVLHLPINTVGTDYVCGDIHGMFHMLESTLNTIGFNKDVDRLICAGDLVDRGYDSELAPQYLAQPWFHSVMGNHDAQYAFHNREFKSGHGLICMPVDEWSMNIPTTERIAIYNALYDNLYPAIEVETNNGLVGIVHAGVPLGMTWGQMVQALDAGDHNVLWECMWDRKVAKLVIDSDEPIPHEHYIVPDVLHVYHGHTIDVYGGCNPYRVGNRYFIDTGANLSRLPDKYPSARFTICKIDQPPQV